MVRLCERYGAYGMYSEEPTFAGLGEGLPARYDAVRNFVRTGGHFARPDPLPLLAGRPHHFSAHYPHADERRTPAHLPLLPPHRSLECGAPAPLPPAPPR